MAAHVYNVRIVANAVGPDASGNMVGNPREIGINITAPDSDTALDRFTAAMQKVMPPACPLCGSMDIALGMRLFGQSLQVVFCSDCRHQSQITITP